MSIVPTTIESAASQLAYEDLEHLSKDIDLGEMRPELAGYHVDESFVEVGDALEGYALKNDATNEVIIVFRGTYSPQDALDDVANLGWRQWEAAKARGIADYIQKIDGKIMFTGHSLGGGLAQYAAYETVANGWGSKADISLVTFNALGAVAGLALNASYDASLMEDVVGAHYINPEDLVSQLTQHIGPETYLIPDASFGPDGFYGAHLATQFTGHAIMKAVLGTPDYLDADESLQDPVGSALDVVKDILAVVRFLKEPSVLIEDVEEAYRDLTGQGAAWVWKMVGGLAVDIARWIDNDGFEEKLNLLLETFGLGIATAPAEVVLDPETNVATDPTIYGTAGDDYLWGFVHGPWYVGNPGSRIDGKDGNDKIYARQGDNVLIGGAGDDLIVGAGGNDRIDGGSGQDKVNGTGGADWIDGGSEDDYVSGDEGNDFLLGGNGNDLVLGGSGSDQLVGGDGDDYLEGDDYNYSGGGDDYVLGGSGNDRLDGGVGNDSLSGGSGNDTLVGGLGSDVLDGGLGDDTFVLGTEKDALNQITDIGGLDTITSEISRSLAAYAAIENLVLEDWGTTGGTGNINGTGNSLNNVIVGNSYNNVLDGAGGSDRLLGDDGDDSLYGGYGNDVLEGGDGDDMLDGGIGSDTLNGGDGADLYILGAEMDRVVDTGYFFDADTITTAITRSLMDYLAIENLTLLGTSDINGTGNGSDNTIIGNSGNNTLDGRAGDDTLVGGGGNDVYVLGGDEDDLVIDSSGTDTITSLATRNLASFAKIENLTLLGTNQINGYGNALNNVIKGNSSINRLFGRDGNDMMDGGAGEDWLYGENGNDVLEGGVGDDTLDGGLGSDTLNGGTGRDTYVLGNEQDKVVDSGGIDRITSTISRSLESYAVIEELKLLGTGSINGIGNALNNCIVGNSRSNVLDGGVGNDELWGGQGNDRLIGGVGHDKLFGGGGRDTFVFNSKPDAKTNVDHVHDFSVADDTIWLENGVFTALGKAGALSTGAFVANDTGLAKDTSDRLIYERDTGELYYDSNGSASGGSTLIAVLEPYKALTYRDFFVI